MGLFGKKKIPDGVRTAYYDGDLPGFTVNAGCQLLVTDSSLRITRINPDIEVNLDKSRITAVEYFISEQDYMKKYKGNAGTSTNKGNIQLYYYVIHYKTLDGIDKHIDVVVTAFELSKMRKEMKKLTECIKPVKYEI